MLLELLLELSLTKLLALPIKLHGVVIVDVLLLGAIDFHTCCCSIVLPRRDRDRGATHVATTAAVTSSAAEVAAMPAAAPTLIASLELFVASAPVKVAVAAPLPVEASYVAARITGELPAKGT